MKWKISFNYLREPPIHSQIYLWILKKSFYTLDLQHSLATANAWLNSIHFSSKDVTDSQAVPQSKDLVLNHWTRKNYKRWKFRRLFSDKRRPKIPIVFYCGIILCFRWMISLGHPRQRMRTILTTKEWQNSREKLSFECVLYRLEWYLAASLHCPIRSILEI